MGYHFIRNVMMWHSSGTSHPLVFHEVISAWLSLFSIIILLILFINYNIAPFLALRQTVTHWTSQVFWACWIQRFHNPLNLDMHGQQDLLHECICDLVSWMHTSRGTLVYNLIWRTFCGADRILTGEISGWVWSLTCMGHQSMWGDDHAQSCLA